MIQWVISRETSCNVELLKYQSLTLEEKIARFENMEAELAKLRLENQVSYVYVYMFMYYNCQKEKFWVSGNEL